MRTLIPVQTFLTAAIRLGICLTMALLPLSSFCYGQDTYRYIPPKETTDGWKTSHMANVGMDSTLFYKLFDQLEVKQHRLHSFLLVKNNSLIIEEYYNGHQASQTHDLRSATKSIQSLLLGVALDKGFVSHIDDPISKYVVDKVPQKNLDPRKKDISIRHLITMSSGLDCNDWDKKSKGQEDRVYRKRDWLQYTLDLPMAHRPGEIARYCSMGAVLTAEIIAQTSGKSWDTFADRYLFRPMGIQNVDWGHTSNKEVITSGKRLYMTSRDMAKIGQLVLNKGQWDGLQLVPEKWIGESTSPKTKIAGIDYGYLWWNLPFQINGKDIVSIAAMGNGGQYIMIVPEMELVAVFTGGAYNSSEDKLPFTIMQQVILPSV